MQLMQMRFTYYATYANEIKLVYIRVELSTISLITQPLQLRSIQLGRWGWNSIFRL